MDNDFDKSLGLGEDFTLRNGETIQVFPAHLIDLKEAGKLYEKMSQYSIPGLYISGNEEALQAFEDLLLMATNQGDLRTAEQEKRDEAVKVILTKFGRVDDGGAEVRQFIFRFLGIVARNSSAAADSQ